MVVGDTCVSERGMATIVGRDKRYCVCGSARGFYNAGELIRKHRPDILLIEPFLGDRDAICWIKELAVEFPRMRILIVSRQSEQIEIQLSQARTRNVERPVTLMKSTKKKWVKPAVKDVPIFFECTCYAGAI